MATGTRLRAAATMGSATLKRWGAAESGHGGRDWRTVLRGGRPHVRLLGAGLCAASASIAVAEILLSGALALYLVGLVRGRAHVALPRIFWIWLLWAALQIMAAVRSGSLSKGGGELRHLGLIAALFLLLPTLNRAADRLAVWRGIFVVGAMSSLVLVARFATRLLWYRGTLDPSVYLRGGGLLHHWMVFATVEVVVFAGLLEFWRCFPRERRWLAPVLVLHTAAILFSLTRTLWLCCLLLLAIDLASRRSRWLWALPALPCVLFLIAPNAVRTRIADSSHLEYYSNAERLQMLRVGWRMIRHDPLQGVGSGRVEELYPAYLQAGEPVPAYHGHLHNNVVQIAAQSGIPAAAAAILVTLCLAWELKKRLRSAASPHEEFVCRAALLALTGFIAAGMFDYTYGHSLGLIVLCFAALTPLTPVEKTWRTRPETKI